MVAWKVLAKKIFSYICSILYRRNTIFDIDFFTYIDLFLIGV